jgi:hypothetical protein
MANEHPKPPIEHVTGPRAQQERTPEQIVLRHAIMEAPVVLGFAGFLAAFFTFDVFPGKPTWMLISALIVFAALSFFVMYASGLFGLMKKGGKKDAG